MSGPAPLIHFDARGNPEEIDRLDGQLLVGIPEIDHQHHALFVLVDSLSALGATPFNEQVSEFFGKLGNILVHHFDSEERLLQKILPSDELAAHIRDHRAFLERYVDISESLMHGKQLTAGQIAEIMRSMIISHVIEHDLPVRKISREGI